MGLVSMCTNNLQGIPGKGALLTAMRYQAAHQHISHN